MNRHWNKRLSRASVVLLTVTIVGAAAQGSGMSFFVTSSGLGNGADLGGLAGADKHCQALATAAGAGSRTWRAYLSADKAMVWRRCMPAIGSAKGHGATPRAR